jgi:hypothetical protein
MVEIRLSSYSPEMTFTELIVSNSSMAQQAEKAIHQMQRITMLQIAYTTLGMVASQLTSLTPKSLSSLDQGKLIDKISIPGNNVESMG